MCCRYLLLQADAQALLARLGVLLAAGAASPATRYNIPPGGRIPAVRPRPGSPSHQPKCHLIGDTLAGEPVRELTDLHWGFTPVWARDNVHPVVNARAESLAEKPTFRDAFRARRCLVPASGFYEWKVAGRTREPWLFRLRDQRPFALPAIWETWIAPDGTAHESCALVTTAPNDLMAPIHHRMPALLAHATDWDAWLDPRITTPDALAPLLRPFPSAEMTALAVIPHVGNVRHDDESCLAPALPGETSSNQLGFTF